jgi:hypothetical protein
VKRLLGVCALLVLAAALGADEPVTIDVEALNGSIGLSYEETVSYEELLEEALAHPLILFGEVHDQESPARQIQRLVHELRQRADAPVRIGVEFVDRDDADLLSAYLEGALEEEAFLARLFPTSLLLSPQVGRAHLEILRFARRYGIEILPLESRPAGSRPRVLRHSEIRWNLAAHLGRHPEERLVVLYGVDHILGEDPISEGLQAPFLVMTSYADSVQERFRSRHGRYPRPGEVLRLRPGVFFDAGEVPRSRRLIQLDLDSREQLLVTIEQVYSGSRRGVSELIEALDDDDVRWRRAAIHALRFASSENMRYDPEADPTQRREAQARWQAWWDRTGRDLYAAP